MAEGEPSNRRSGKEDVEDLLLRLQLHEEEGNDFVWEEEATTPEIQSKWLTITRVYTSKGFSPLGTVCCMESNEGCWRQVESNLYTVQFNCLGDWNTAMAMGPWLFRNQVVIIKEYDGF